MRAGRGSPPPADLTLLPSVRAGIARIGEAYAGAPGDGIPRIMDALRTLIAPLIPPAPSVFATALASTEAFAALLEAMRADPGACVRAYNRACAAHPDAGMRPLVAEEAPGQVELPLWRLVPGERKRPVFARELPSIPAHELAPRALLMTGLVRLFACDLFIHGFGGGGLDGAGGYEAINDGWFAAWRETSAPVRAALPWPPAPYVTVTATRLLPLGAEAPPTAAEAARAVWRAHHALHDPGALHDPAGAARVLVGSLPNLSAVCAAAADDPRPVHILCAGTRDEITLDDCLPAGAMVERLVRLGRGLAAEDSARLCLHAWLGAVGAGAAGVVGAMRSSRGGRNLVRLGMDADVEYCSTPDTLDVVPVFDAGSGLIRR